MDIDMNIGALRNAFLNGLDPEDFYSDLMERIDAEDPKIWITRLTREQLGEYLKNLDSLDPEKSPLWGIPFAIKDNIDLAGVPSTAACPDYAYTPEKSSGVVRRLVEAGAIPLGKTNLDQFATGLVGVRSPYGFPKNALNPELVPGGSSSGSAVSVAKKLVSFALGTDTAGSGRVPAALNGIVGYKPSKGLLSCSGVVPACRSLDCVSVFAGSCEDARIVGSIAQGYDDSDPFSRHPVRKGRIPGARFRFGVPMSGQLKFFGNDDLARRFDAAVGRLVSLGGIAVEIDFSPFAETAHLLYEGPWVAERYIVAGTLIEEKPDALLPVTRGIISGGAHYSAADTFLAEYRLEALRGKVAPVWNEIDFLFLPTAGLAPTVAEVEADPVGVNSNLGTYTNFVNLLDLCACAVPADPDRPEFPFGVTILAPAFRDDAVLNLAAKYNGEAVLQEASGADRITVAVCGAHMRGEPLNKRMLALGGEFVSEAKSAPVYRMFALEPTCGLPERPGMVRLDASSGDEGVSFELELWSLPLENFGPFVSEIAAPLAMGTVVLDGGATVMGFVCEGHAAASARDISSYGGWRAWRKAGR